MKINNRILSVTLGLVALTSCASINTKDSGKKNTSVKYINPEYDPNEDLKDIVKEFKKEKVDYLKNINKNSFEVSNLPDMYEGEEIYLKNESLNKNVSIVKLFTKKPSLVYKEGSEGYSKYKVGDKDGIVVEEKKGNELFPDKPEVSDVKYKVVVDNNKNYVYIQVRDNVNGVTKDIRLDEKVSIINRPDELKDNIKYTDLKVINKDKRVKYSINTIDEPFEDVDLGEIERDNQGVEYIDYSKYFEADKYNDLDNFAGFKRVSIVDHIDGLQDKEYIRNIEFGHKLSDYKNKFSELLTDLNEKTLKLSDDGTVKGGFNEGLVSEILKYSENVKNEGKIEFKTEILDKDKTVGIHNISRKIIRDGKVIFEKKDKTFISFDGVNVGVADGTFFDLSDEVEARVYRGTAKEDDKIKDFKKDAKYDNDRKLANMNIDRQHGATVIGSMIDENVLGDRFYWYGHLTGMLSKIGETGELPDFISTRAELNNFIGRVLTNLQEKYKHSEIMQKYLADKIQSAAKKLDEISALIEDGNTSETLKNEKYKVMYKELADLSEEIYRMTEVDKLKYSNLHFTTISVGVDDSHISAELAAKNISSILDMNKNIKAINMSYGGNNNVEEYIALKGLTEKDYEKGAKAFNTDYKFKNAVLSWLKNEDLTTKDNLKKYYDGELGIPSVYEYFDKKNEITKEDYKKLVDLRLLTLEHRLKSSPELVAANHDVLFVRSAGNTYNDAPVNLVDYDEDGKKIPYYDTNYKYNNDFASIPSFLNELEKKKALEEGREYKYNYNYRKNILGSVGLAPKSIAYGEDATEDISDDWGLNTDKINYKRLKLYGVGMLSEYNNLIGILNDINLHPEKYPKGYKEEVLKRIKVVDDMSEKHKDFINDDTRFSFSRAGKAMLWTMATDGSYVYTKRLTEEEKKYGKGENIGENIAYGSSFSAPRMTAVAGMIAEKYPWMSAHDIKTSLLTTTIDDYRIIYKKADPNKPEGADNVKILSKGLYGVDENIGWGIMDKDSALDGPARFVKALTHEVGEENFIANIPYGTYTFSNSIKGGFDPIKHMSSRGFITFDEGSVLTLTSNFKDKELLSDDFLEKHDNVKKVLEKTNITISDIVNRLRPKIKGYIPSLDFEERELFYSAGLEKHGNGTLILSGNNTYTEPTYIKGGTLVVQGVQNSDVYVSENTKLKIDSVRMEQGNYARILLGLEPIKGGIYANVYNKGKLYSYSEKDSIFGTYKPYENSETIVATGGRLSVDKLDLSDMNHFNISLFRKYGMLTFKLPETKKLEDYTEEDVVENKKEDTEDTINKKLVFVAKDVPVEDISKFNFGVKSVSSGLNLVTELSKDKDKNVVKMYLERKEHIEDVLNKKTEMPTTLSSKLRNKIINEMSSTLDKNELSRLAISLDNLEIADEEDLEKLNGDILSDSLTLGTEISDINNRELLNTLDGNNKQFNVFARLINRLDSKMVNSKKRLYSINGMMLGFSHNIKISDFSVTTNVGVSYEHSLLKDLRFKVKYPNDDTKVLGNVNVNSVGLGVANKIGYKNFELDTLIGFDYLDKHISRELLDKHVEDTRSSDLILNFNNVFGYRYNKDINSDIKLSIKPYIGLNMKTYIKGSYNENNDFGYRSESEIFFKPTATIGSKLALNYKNYNFELFADYTKYLVDTTIESKATLKEYKFTRNIEGISLEDNLVNFGIKFDKKYGNVNLGLSYINKNIKSNAINASLKFEF